MAENDEPTIDVPKKSPIKVIKKPDTVKYHDKLSTKPAPHPEGYDFFWMLADVYLVDKKYEEGYFIESYQVDTFEEGNEVVLEVDIPLYIRTHPNLDINSLQLLFCNTNNKEWKPISHKRIVEGTTSVIVTIPNPWIKDPPLGWGGNLPQSAVID